MREKFDLSPVEINAFHRLPPLPGEAMKFWQTAATLRGVDPKTVLSEGALQGRGVSFTALPKGHGKHWCFPIPLRCNKKPVYKE